MEDIRLLRNHCESLYEDFGLGKVETHAARFWSVLSDIQPILSRNAATPNPSLFKRASATTISFMMHPPLDIPFTGGKLSKKICEYPNHHNAIAAFEYCRRALFMAQIHKKGKKVETLEKPIRVSRHFYGDVIHAISCVKTDGSFHFLALLYESLTYTDNPTACYERSV